MRAMPLFAAFAALSLGGCAYGSSADDAAMAGGAGASATLARADGSIVGTATVRPMTSGLALRVTASGLQPGTYGIHVHQTGKCEGPGFTSAGAHWNPAARQHGTANPAGPHAGDLPNIVIAADGNGSLDAMLGGAMLDGATGLLDADGAALIIHAAADDLRSDPTGNSGARQVCGVFVRTN